jgi:hypothetical protein
MQQSDQMSEQEKLEHARVDLASVCKDVQLVIACLRRLTPTLQRLEAEIVELERRLLEPDASVGQRTGVFTEATGSSVPVTESVTGASFQTTSLSSTQSRSAGGFPLGAGRVPLQDEATPGWQSPGSPATPTGHHQGQHGNALQPLGASGVALAPIPAAAPTPSTSHLPSGLVGQNVQGAAQPQGHDYRGNPLPVPTAPESFGALGGHGGYPSIAAAGFGGGASPGGFGAATAAAGFGGGAGPGGFGAASGMVGSGVATAQSGFGVPGGAVDFGAPGSHGGFGASGGHAGFGGQAPSTTMSASPVAPVPRPTSMADVVQLAGRVWSAYLRRQLEQGKRFNEAEASEVLRQALGPLFNALRTPEATSDYVVVTLSGLSEVLVLPSKYNVGQNTPFVQSFYQLRAELPSGSPAEVVVAAVVQPNNLRFPPAEGAIDRGILRIKAS